MEAHDVQDARELRVERAAVNYELHLVAGLKVVLPQEEHPEVPQELLQHELSVDVVFEHFDGEFDLGFRGWELLGRFARWRGSGR